jgi:TPR repeat protein
VAVKWYREAADQGYAFAQYNLGLCYWKGEGVPQDDLEAYVWLSLAAAQGHEISSQARDDAAERMSRAEIVEGQRRAAAFVAKKVAPSQGGESTSFAGTRPNGSGTGFFITGDGYLLSRIHAVAIEATVGKDWWAYDQPHQIVRRISSPNSDRIH